MAELVDAINREMWIAELGNCIARQIISENLFKPLQVRVLLQEQI